MASLVERFEAKSVIWSEIFDLKEIFRQSNLLILKCIFDMGVDFPKTSEKKYISVSKMQHNMFDFVIAGIIKKVVWTIVSIIAFVWMCIQLNSIFDEYFANHVTVSIDIRSERQLNFPRYFKLFNLFSWRLAQCSHCNTIRSYHYHYREKMYNRNFTLPLIFNREMYHGNASWYILLWDNQTPFNKESTMGKYHGICYIGLTKYRVHHDFPEIQII